MSFLIFFKFVLLSKRAAVGFYCVLAIVCVGVCVRVSLPRDVMAG